MMGIWGPWIWSIQILTVVSKVGMEVPGALEAVPDLLELRTTDLVIVNLLGHLIWIYEIPTVSIETFIIAFDPLVD